MTPTLFILLIAAGLVVIVAGLAALFRLCWPFLRSQFPDE